MLNNKYRRQNRYFAKFLYGLFLAAVSIVVHGAPTIPQLTEEEQDWLAEHPVIRMAPEPDFAPFERLSYKGKYEGLAADYIALFGKRLGVEFKLLESNGWPQTLELLQDGKIDIIPAAAESPQRQRYLLFSKPYISVPGVIISSQPFNNIDELRNSKVAVVTGYIWDDLLSHHNIDVRLVRVEDTRTGLELAAMGAVDAMLGDLATTTTNIREGGITNLRIVTRLDRNLELGVGIRKDWPIFQTIMDKTIASIKSTEHDAIKSKWLKLETPSLLKNRTFWYVTLGSFGFFFLVLSGIVFWNRALKRQVEIRSQALKDAQMKLIRAEKMESIGRLAAGVAHEVKNPLAIIQMGADFLSKESTLNEPARKIVNEIDDAVVRADNVIRGLLDFSRDQKFATEPAQINEVLDRSLKLVSHEMRNRSIEVEMALARNLPDIEMDFNKLQQVFVNLMMNAAQAMPNGGSLNISSKLFSIDDKSLLRRDSGNEFRIGEKVLGVEISDTGPGIPVRHLERLFDPFFSTKPVGEGTGLGLSVSRNIIHLHHGFIDVRNRKPEGVSVLIVFKLSKGE